MRTIVTTHICPPIPVRQFDWCAHYEGEEEAGSYGYGATEAEAIEDFKANYMAEHDERLAGKSHNPILQGEWKAHVGWANSGMNEQTLSHHPNWCEVTGPNGLSINGHFGIEVARHIAATPNALEALRLHVAYEALPADRGGKDGPKGKARAAFVAARDAALAKAEGR